MLFVITEIALLRIVRESLTDGAVVARILLGRGGHDTPYDVTFNAVLLHIRDVV